MWLGDGIENFYTSSYTSEELKFWEMLFDYRIFLDCESFILLESGLNLLSLLSGELSD